MTVDLNLPELQALTREIRGLREDVSALQRTDIPEFCTKRMCAELKGLGYETLRHMPNWIWPNYGEHESALKNGKYSKVFHRDQVIAWLPKTEEQLEAEYRNHVRLGFRGVA